IFLFTKPPTSSHLPLPSSTILTTNHHHPKPVHRKPDTTAGLHNQFPTSNLCSPKPKPYLLPTLLFDHNLHRLHILQTKTHLLLQSTPSPPHSNHPRQSPSFPEDSATNISPNVVVPPSGHLPRQHDNYELLVRDRGEKGGLCGGVMVVLRQRRRCERSDYYGVVFTSTQRLHRLSHQKLLDNVEPRRIRSTINLRAK
ncbi:hypothetical protein M8C21_031207, partial [Ambrosia artemisiifolia]